MSRKTKVGLIFGGRSGEHEISLASAQSVARAINRDKYDVVLIGITKQGQWVAGKSALRELVAASPSPLLNASNVQSESDANEPHRVGAKDLVPEPQATSNVSPLGAIDVAFPLIHGTFGEDGTIQGLLELADIPYVGAGVAASAVGMDKGLMKAVFAAHQLPQVDWRLISRRDWERQPETAIREIEESFGYPCFVKPANLGSSVGISKAHDRAELRVALDTAAVYDRKIIAERAAMNAREIECSVLGNDEPIASLPGEVIPRREFYDYAAKYEDNSGTELIVPADLSTDVRTLVQDVAVRAFKAIDCSGMARVDFFIERESGCVLLNEINTIPGFTAVSMYPRMWAKSGLSYPMLIDRLIECALERHADKKRTKTSYS